MAESVPAGTVSEFRPDTTTLRVPSGLRQISCEPDIRNLIHPLDFNRRRTSRYFLGIRRAVIGRQLDDVVQWQVFVVERRAVLTNGSDCQCAPRRSAMLPARGRFLFMRAA
jgi:hypothetical protein